MDLQNRIRRNDNQSNISPAPFRQSGADRGNFLQPSNRTRNPNRQVPQSVQFQPEYEEALPLAETQPSSEVFTPPATTDTPHHPAFAPQDTMFLQQKAEQPLQNSDNFSDTVPAVSVLSNYAVPNASSPMIPQEQAMLPVQETETVFHSSETNNQMPVESTMSTQVGLSFKEKNDIEKSFFAALESLFNRYDIDKILIVENKVYTVSFTGEEDQEIFDEIIDENILNQFTKHFVTDGYYEALLNNGCKLEMTHKPVSEFPTIIVSKTQADFLIDEEFVAILFEFLSKGKNVVILSNFAIDTMYKVVSDFFNNNLCVAINEPIKTNNNVVFRENPLKPSLKTVYSIAQKIEPDNTLVYAPTDIMSTIGYMKKNNSVVLFSETDTPSDFINADVFHSLGGQSEYNKISILRAIDVIFMVSPTKKGTIKYTATQLLSPTNKSHINKIKKIVGDYEIDTNKLYFNNLFEKEV